MQCIVCIYFEIHAIYKLLLISTLSAFCFLSVMISLHACIMTVWSHWKRFGSADQQWAMWEIFLADRLVRCPHNSQMLTSIGINSLLVMWWLWWWQREHTVWAFAYLHMVECVFLAHCAWHRFPAAFLYLCYFLSDSHLHQPACPARLRSPCLLYLTTKQCSNRPLALIINILSFQCSELQWVGKGNKVF